MTLQQSTNPQVAHQEGQAPTLDLALLQKTLAQCAIGHTIHSYARVSSTMPLAHELVRHSAAQERLSGTVISADEQSAGRGRQQRSWFAPPATSLLLSIILQPPHLALSPALLPMVAGVAIVQAIEAVCPPLAGTVGLKWPNDVVLNAHLPVNTGSLQQQKVAGILVETTFHGSTLDYAILGLGINVNQTLAELPPAHPKLFPATSLRVALGQPVDRTELFAILCRTLNTLVSETPHQQIVAAWRGRLTTLGQPVTVTLFDVPSKRDHGATLTGTAVDVTAEGALVVQEKTGQLHTFYAGDVSIRPLSSEP